MASLFDLGLFSTHLIYVSTCINHLSPHHGHDHVSETRTSNQKLNGLRDEGIGAVSVSMATCCFLPYERWYTRYSGSLQVSCLHRFKTQAAGSLPESKAFS